MPFGPRLAAIVSRPVLLELVMATLLLLVALSWNAWRHLGVWRTLGWSPWSLPLALLAALPPLLLIPLLESSFSQRCRWLRVLRDNITSLLAPFLGNLRWTEMVGLSFLAGLSEEVFFRGVLQQEIGLVFASLAFGLLHTVSLPYMIWATLMGCYLGWLWQLTHDLWLLIITHAVIDFVGLGYIRLVVEPRRLALSSPPHSSGGTRRREDSDGGRP